MNDFNAWLNRHLCKLNNVDKMSHPQAFNRLGLTNEEAAAHRQFLAIAHDLGLETDRDLAGNYWAIWKVDDNAPTIAMGSHLDTVYDGGGYDGVVGVLCALASIKVLKDKHIQPVKNIAIICFVSEESARFGISSIGSKAVSGQLDFHELQGVTDEYGITVEQALKNMDINWKEMDQAILPVNELEQFLEVHIEQGDKLQEHNTQIGIVTEIARPTRLIVKISGQTNHTGTTSMHRRNDALVAASPLISYIHDETLNINNHTDPYLVATVSTMHLEPNSMTSIPGEVELGIDIRSIDRHSKTNMTQKIMAYCRQIEIEHAVTIQNDILVDNVPVSLDATVQDKLCQVSEKLSFRTEKVVSGAGHDVMNMANRWPSGLIFIPCLDGISHHPKEYAALEDIANGTEVLAAYIQAETT